MAIRLLLGPQRPVLNLGEAIADANLPEGPLAVIAAGWQEAEGDIDDVAAAAGRDVINLHLYRRAEEIFAADPALLQAYRRRQDRLQEIQRLYGMRLRRTLAAAREMLRAEGDSALTAPEQRHAIAQLRALDRHHLLRVQALHGEFDSEFDVARHELLARHHAEIGELLAGVETVVITGGNVAVLLNRLLLFDVAGPIAAKHIVAWSAGAMALAGRIVLFHDNAPQGRRNPELFGCGLDLIPQHVFLPDAKHRLRINDRTRLALFSRRLAPAACITLDSGSALRMDGERVVYATGAKQIAASGRMHRVRPT